MKQTSNYGLKKPEGQDVVNIDDLNYNTDILDKVLKEIEAKVSNISIPVKSVNSKTGDIVLKAEDIKTSENVSLEDRVKKTKEDIKNIQTNTSNDIQNLASKMASLQGQLNSFSSVKLRGSSATNSTLGTKISHALNSTNYSVNITIASNPNLQLGELWVIKGMNEFTVFNSGIASINFDYLVF